MRSFQDVTRAPRKAIDLTHEEDHWIKSAYIGALVWAEPYEVTDFNEYYPYILAHGSAYLPVGPGEFRTFTHISIDPISYNLEYGIYRAFKRIPL